MVDLWVMADVCTPWRIHAVVTLRVAEQIEAGKRAVAEIVEAARCDPWVLYRVLQHLVNRGVFEGSEPGRFVLNEAARGLMDPMLRVGLDLDGFGGQIAVRSLQGRPPLSRAASRLDCARWCTRLRLAHALAWRPVSSSASWKLRVHARFES